MLCKQFHGRVRISISINNFAFTGPSCYFLIVSIALGFSKCSRKAYPLHFSEESWFSQYYSRFVNSLSEPAHKRLNVCRPFFFASKIRDKLLFLFSIPLMRIMLTSCHSVLRRQRILLQPYNLNKEKAQSYAAYNAEKSTRENSVRAGVREGGVCSLQSLS